MTTATTPTNMTTPAKTKKTARRAKLHFLDLHRTSLDERERGDLFQVAFQVGGSSPPPSCSTCCHALSAALTLVILLSTTPTHLDHGAPLSTSCSALDEGALVHREVKFTLQDDDDHVLRLQDCA